MDLKALRIIGCAAVFPLAPLAVFAAEAPATAATEQASEAPKENPELEAEISYVEALVNNGYPDIAEPVIVETKKKWPESEARFFAIEIRGMLALGQFEQAEKKIGALPDRKSSKYWAARLEVANNYFGRGQKQECMKIYNEFFKVFPKPPKDIFKFYINASYAYGQLLVGEKMFARAAQIYSGVLGQIKDEEQWCNLACETAEIYIRIASGEKDAKKRESYLATATKVVDKLLWQLEKPVYFGRGVSMKAHIEELRGDAQKASELIDEYKSQLEELHGQILQIDPEGSLGLIKQSPLPECMYLQAKILWDEAKKEYASAKRDDEKVKSLMFGPRGANGKRQVAKGAFAKAQNVFLNYEMSAWAVAAGELTEEIKAFAKEKYKANVKTKVTPQQIAKVRAAQFRSATEKFGANKFQEAIDDYMAVLAKYPELPESIAALENVANCYIELATDTKDKTLKDEYRWNADAIEAHLAERFAGHREKAIMVAGGDAAIRLAAKEQERRENARAQALYMDFLHNYTAHSSAPNLAAAKAMEAQKAEKWETAVAFWSVVSEIYTNSSVYAASLAQLSFCWGKLGDAAKEIDYISKYVGIEKVKIRRMQAEMQLAQMYQRDGLALLDGAATNATPEEVTAAETRGCAQMIRAIKQFSLFSGEADKAIADPGTNKDDVPKYKMLREAALFLVGECWSRLTKPADKLAAFRARAAKSYEDYITAYPDGKYTKICYVKLGTIYTALGDMEKCKASLARLSKAFPDSEEAKNAKPRLAKSLIEMGMKREGAEIYSEMLRTDADYSAPQFVAAGDSLVEAKNWDLANQAYEKAVKIATTNQTSSVARARIGQARSAYLQGSYAEAREILDGFLADPKLSRLSLAADANFLMVKIASDQGRNEKDAMMRGKYFGAAIGALKKVRMYWAKKPRWEQDTLDLLSGDVLIDRMNAEESMGLKEEAKETRGRAASTFQVFIQAHGVTDEHPFDKMEDGERANLERAYATVIPLFAKLGAEQADRVMKFGEDYLRYFPDGKAKTEIVNCMNQAKADLPAKK